jgi:hypothetical protein
MPTLHLLHTACCKAQCRLLAVISILPDYIVVCLFSLLGLTLSAVVLSVVLSYASFETINMMFSPLG